MGHSRNRGDPLTGRVLCIKEQCKRSGRFRGQFEGVNRSVHFVKKGDSGEGICFSKLRDTNIVSTFFIPMGEETDSPSGKDWV